MLRLNMLYATNDGSYQMAATGMRMTEGIEMSKVAAFKRIGKSGEWLRWMARELCAAEGSTIPKPTFLGERDVLLVDASDETTRGRDKDTWRLHYVFNLFAFQCASAQITGNGSGEGERLTRHEIKAGGIYVADRIYCTIIGMEHVLCGGGDFLLRFKSKAFKLYDEGGTEMELLPRLRGLKPLESAEVRCFYKDGGQLRPVRIVAMRKEEEAIKACHRKMKRKVSKKQEKQVQADTMELNEYIVVATSLGYTNDQILELYRARWQIEQVFYRLKSLFGYGNTPNKLPETASAWFYAKLLLAALCECIHKRMSFPPELDPILCDLVGAQFMERAVPDSQMGDIECLAT